MQQLFLASSADEVMDDIIKHLSFKPNHYQIAFINTAAESEKGDHWWVKADRKKAEEVGFTIDEFSITGMDKNHIEERLKDKQGIFVCGGNSFYLLDQVIKSGFDQILKDKINKGIIYIGSSAGSMIIGKNIDLVPDIDDPTQAPGLKSDGLGIIDLAIQPHWGNKIFKNEYKKSFNNIYNGKAKIILLRDNQYILVEDQNYQIVQV